MPVQDYPLLDYDYREVKVTQAILESARKTCLVTDKSKLGRKVPVRVGHVSQLSDLFMDELPSEALHEVCVQHAVNVHTVA